MSATASVGVGIEILERQHGHGVFLPRDRRELLGCVLGGCRLGGHPDPVGAAEQNGDADAGQRGQDRVVLPAHTGIDSVIRAGCPGAIDTVPAEVEDPAENERDGKAQ